MFASKENKTEKKNVEQSARHRRACNGAISLVREQYLFF
jgi:hypothetical protein